MEMARGGDKDEGQGGELRVIDLRIFLMEDSVSSPVTIPSLAVQFSCLCCLSHVLLGRVYSYNL